MRKLILNVVAVGCCLGILAGFAPPAKARLTRDAARIAIAYYTQWAISKRGYGPAKGLTDYGVGQCSLERRNVWLCMAWERGYVTPRGSETIDLDSPEGAWMDSMRYVARGPSCRRVTVRIGQPWISDLGVRTYDVCGRRGPRPAA